MNNPDPFDFSAFGKAVTESSEENRTMAKFVRDFHQACLIEGFSDDQAMKLAHSWMVEIVRMVAAQ